MATTSKARSGKKDARRRDYSRALFKRRKFCRFTAEGIEWIDYKDVDLLKDFISEAGKIIPARITGTNTLPGSVWRGRSATRSSNTISPSHSATPALKAPRTSQSGKDGFTSAGVTSGFSGERRTPICGRTVTVSPSIQMKPFLLSFI